MCSSGSVFVLGVEGRWEGSDRKVRRWGSGQGRADLVGHEG